MTLSIAHVPVFGAIACTLYFNGSYAYGHANAAESQIAMVALALTIDLAKATFLPTAAHLAAKGRKLGPLLLTVLWLPAFCYSTFAGYAYLTTTRTTAQREDVRQDDQRSRSREAYERATADLATAKTSPEWKVTAGCTKPTNQGQRAFCTNITGIARRLDDSSKALNQAPPITVNPEVRGLAQVTGWSMPTLAFAVALFPAVLIELIAGLGLFALRHRPGDRASAPQDQFQPVQAQPPTPEPKTASNAAQTTAGPQRATWRKVG